MSSTININVYSDALVVLGTAGIAVPLVRRLGLNPVLGYLCAGALLGPLGIGSLAAKFPFLYWLTIVDAKNVAGIAELGIVFLFFLIGLETSLRRLIALRSLVFGLGGLQVLLTSTLLFLLAKWAGQPTAAAIILGTCLSLSSTAIVLELLSAQKRLTSTTGRTIFSILLAQDLAVLPVLMFISILGGNTGGSLFQSLLKALLQALIALAAIVIVGRFLLRPIFRGVATVHSQELFIAAVLFVIIGAGVVAHQAGLSMSLGAFVAGSMLAETEYSKAVETTVEPFKGLLLGIFFFTVGMNIDFRELLREPWLLAGVVVGLLLAKSIVLLGLTKLFRFSWPAAIETSVLLGPGGEFAFVAIGMAAASGFVSHHLSSFVIAVTTISMLLTPALATAAGRGTHLLVKTKTLPNPELTAVPGAREGHAIVVGYGRVGKVVCSLLKEHKLPYIAADHDPASVTKDREEGHEVYYGDATDPGFLETCGLMQASGIIVTTHDQRAIDHIVEHVRTRRSDILIVSRAWDANHARHLYKVGVTDVVPETIEASLQLSQSVLVRLGVEPEEAMLSIHEKRNEFRRDLLSSTGQ